MKQGPCPCGHLHGDEEPFQTATPKRQTESGEEQKKERGGKAGARRQSKREEERFKAEFEVDVRWTELSGECRLIYRP
jgi:hypothetical protein